MEDNSRFLYLEQFMTALEDLDDDDRYRATYCLCYYGLYRDFPDEATAVDKMYIKANAKLFEGQDKYAAKQAERGKKGGPAQEVTDEEIEGAILTLFKNRGRIPKEGEILEFLGATSTIRKRAPWKDRNKICGNSHELETKKCGEQKQETKLCGNELETKIGTDEGSKPASFNF